MSYTYAQQKKRNSKNTDTASFLSKKQEASLPNSAMVENLGHQVDMPTVMREKMEGAFGMDLSAVKLYENKAVGDAGAEAVTQGSKIVFAPGKLDFSSTHGQALLGHEISHAASQAKGEVRGSGLVNDSALEARADREGMMAARGMSISEGYGDAAAALSNASAASAAGPMQAKSGKKKREEQEIRDRARADSESALYSANSRDEKDEDADLDDELDAYEAEKKESVDKMFQLSAAQLQQGQEYDKALKKKIQELIPKYYAEAKKRGLSEEKAQDEAQSLANDEARDILKVDDYNYLSEDEEKWLYDMFDHPSLGVTREVSRRRNQRGKAIYDYRQNLAALRPGEDEGKLDLETAYSPAATSYGVYDYILAMSRNDRIAKQLFEEDKNSTAEEKKIQTKAYDIAVGGANDSNPYLQTEQGKELETRLLQQHTDRLRKLSGKKKRLGKGKK